MTRQTARPEFAELRPIRSSDPAPSGAVPGLRESELISARDGAERLWLARVVAAPGLVSPGHHHGESEAAFFVLRGQITFFFGEGLRRRLDLHPGDAVFIPPWTIHAEGNLGEADDEVLAIRSTPQPTAFYLPDLRVPDDVLGARPTRG